MHVVSKWLTLVKQMWNVCCKQMPNTRKINVECIYSVVSILILELECQFIVPTCFNDYSK